MANYTLHVQKKLCKKNVHTKPYYSNQDFIRSILKFLISCNRNCDKLFNGCPPNQHNRTCYESSPCSIKNNSTNQLSVTYLVYKHSLGIDNSYTP